MGKIYETYRKIYQEIIPNTPYTPIKNIILHFEKYDYRFHWNRDNSVIENCIVESRDTLRANTVYQGTPDEIKIVSEKNFRYAL